MTVIVTGKFIPEEVNLLQYQLPKNIECQKKKKASSFFVLFLSAKLRNGYTMF